VEHDPEPLTKIVQGFRAEEEVGSWRVLPGEVERIAAHGLKPLPKILKVGILVLYRDWVIS